MHFIEELVVNEFLPTFRSMLAEALRERELTQSDVADLLGISQSAVSKYVHGEVERNPLMLDDRPLAELVDRLADGLVSGDVTPVQALVETEVFIRELERGGLLAQLHAQAEPALADYEGEFSIHDSDSRLRAAERTLSAVRRGLSIVENTGGFTTIIPAVGSNLVQALPDACRVEDVAAVPGRIVDVKGRATIPAEPEFGVSQHVAGVLLAARDAGSDARAALNVRYDEAFLDRLEIAGNQTVEFDAERDLESAIDAAFTDHSDRDVDVLYQTGGFGVEPIIYVLGPDAVVVAETVRELR